MSHKDYIKMKNQCLSCKHVDYCAKGDVIVEHGNFGNTPSFEVCKDKELRTSD